MGVFYCRVQSPIICKRNIRQEHGQLHWYIYGKYTSNVLATLTTQFDSTVSLYRVILTKPPSAPFCTERNYYYYYYHYYTTTTTNNNNNNNNNNKKKKKKKKKKHRNSCNIVFPRDMLCPGIYALTPCIKEISMIL
jgi:hypothetical protein